MGVKIVKDCQLMQPVVVSTDESIVEVAKKLHHFQERRVFVIDKKKSPVGIISIVDINDRVVAKGRDLKKTKAKDIMSYPLNFIADVNDSLKEVMKKMISKDNYYVPVTEKGAFKGLLIYSNLKKALSD